MSESLQHLMGLWDTVYPGKGIAYLKGGEAISPVVVNFTYLSAPDRSSRIMGPLVFSSSRHATDSFFSFNLQYRVSYFFHEKQDLRATSKKFGFM